MKLNYLILLILYLTNSFSVFSQIINEGTLKVESATIVYFGNEYTNNGTHANDGDLYLNSNFINNDSTSAIAGTTFFNSSINAIQTISGLTSSVNFYNLTINNGLTGVEVVDNFGIIVGNAVSLVAGDFRLIGDSQLIQTHTGLDINSSVSGTLLKDQQGTPSTYAYNYWSSPVNNGMTFSLLGGIYDGTDANLNPFSPQQILFSSANPFNGTPSVLDGGGNVTTPLTISSRWTYKYLREGGNFATWIKLDENSALNPAEGFTMKGTNTAASNQNYVFKGVPNDGDYEVIVNFDEFFLIGNPYPSAIDSEEFIKDNISVIDGGNALLNNITGTLYFWVEGGSTSHNTSNYYGGYATRNLTGGAPPSVASIYLGGLGSSEFVAPPERYMAVAQGFFVKGNVGTSVSFKNSQRIFKTESSGESIHYKNSATKKNTDKSIIRIGYEDPEGFHRQLVLGFIPNSPANLNYNVAYDAFMFGARQDELFFIIENDIYKKYVIQGIGAYDDTLELPIGLNISQEGKHTVMLDSIENFNGTIYLKDKFLNTTHNLSESNYEPNLSAGAYLDRFQIVFQPQNTLNNDEFNISQLHVYYDRDNNIIVNNKNRLKLKEILIYNILGQRILSVKDKLLEQKEIIIPFNKKEGVYLVKVETEYSEETFKILKNN
jgi:hypothetical protein